MKIIPLQVNETVQYAAAELQKYITWMSRGQLVPQIVYDASADRKDAIVLGLLEDLGRDTSDLFDPFIEDILDIDVENGAGFIAGSNPRSILMGVYKYCYSAGCRFLRPGPDGDYVPQADVMNHSFRYRKKADQPFRGECSEGSISYEHMRDTVYWLPKIGLNMYMIEGIVPYSYMHKWYGHVGNTQLRQAGQEYGAKTGRPRRVGPVDLVATRYGVEMQGATQIALTKLDVLSDMEKIPVCVRYQVNGEETDDFPFPTQLDKAKPVIEYADGWQCDISGVRKWEDLPAAAQNYVSLIEKAISCPITMISVGAERDSMIRRT